MLHLVLLHLEPGEELLDAVLLLVLVAKASSAHAPSPDGCAVSPEPLGDLLEGLIVDTASQLVGGQLRSDLLPELHAGAG